jgi:BirA family biotin operon repressor/biotin-[acetyl-CoA-carboxylase] ligase
MVSTDHRSHPGVLGSIGRPLIRFDRVSSTMDLAAAFAELGAPVGTTVQAGFQTAGRGRSGKSWAADAGTSLMLSIVLRPPTSGSGLGKLSLLAGLAVARMTEALTSLPTEVKWPNDVLVGGRKVAGILLHSRSMRNTGSRYLVLGIGINVRSTPQPHAPHATSLTEAAGKTVELDDVFHRLVLELNRVHQSFLAEDVASAWAELQDRLAYRGQDVSIVDGERNVSGTVAGIGAHGELLLRQSGGAMRSIVSGELTRGPSPIHR